MPYLKDMPTFNEALGGKDYIWAVIRFVVVPKGTPADRKAYLAAGVKAAMSDPELVAEYRKAGVFFDPALMSSTRLADDLNRYAEREKRVLPADRPAEVADRCPARPFARGGRPAVASQLARAADDVDVAASADPCRQITPPAAPRDPARVAALHRHAA